jgi:ABC-type antimicrobial peptide transport system permease subunit
VSKITLLVAVGIVAGVATSMVAAQAARSMLFRVQPYDLPTLIFAVFALIIVALAAILVPTFRAVRLYPLAALRRD